jgi:hypothetical protein
MFYRTQSCVIPSLRTMSRNAPAHEDRDVNQSPRPPSICLLTAVFPRVMFVVWWTFSSSTWDQVPFGSMMKSCLDILFFSSP